MGAWRSSSTSLEFGAGREFSVASVAKLELKFGQEISAEMEVLLSPQTEPRSSRQSRRERVRAPVKKFVRESQQGRTG
jgi:hypothetical protein